MTQIDEYYKIAFIGDSNVGKTSFITSYMKDKKTMNGSPTIGVGFNVQNIEIYDKNNKEKVVKVGMWDTAGQERFRSIIKLYFKSVHGFVIMYDTQSKNPEKELRHWLDIIDEENAHSYKIILCNKMDLPVYQDSVGKGRKIAKEYNIPFMETSVTNMLNIHQSLNLIINCIQTNHKGYNLNTKIERNRSVSLYKKNDVDNNQYCKHCSVS